MSLLPSFFLGITLFGGFPPRGGGSVALPYGMTELRIGPSPSLESHGMSRPPSWDGDPDLAVPEGAVDGGVNWGLDVRLRWPDPT
jgi:hypothetical protein